MSAPPVVYAPSEEAVASSALMAFARHAQERTGRSLPDSAALHAWSLASFREFWALFLDWSELLVEGDAGHVCEGNSVETASFFPGLRLNYAENLLRALDPAGEAAPALLAFDESGPLEQVSRAALRERVQACASALDSLGVRPGDRVVALARNTPESIVCCLAAAALGATWSSTSPDLGIDAIAERFRPLAPKLLITHGELTMQGVRRPLAGKITALLDGVPTLVEVVALDGAATTLPKRRGLRVHEYGALLADGARRGAIPWRRFPFNHPLFVLFSSGTTGAPKCIVHGAGGTLLEHVKEHRLHGDLGPADRLYFHTSCGWMMWNWLLSGLACGATLVLYDGSVSHPEPDSLLRHLDAADVTLFGTSPAYLQYLREAGIVPRERFRFRSLRGILSTGSVLGDGLYDWVDDNFKHVPLQSISGGTDIIGCFVLGNPTLPVYRGESQCISLGLDVRALADGVARQEGTGELVCTGPFPSRPVGFVDDPEGARFHDAYFSQHAGVWTHGDLVELTARGTARILGRSDGTLNVRGVRIGPAEIYRIVLDLREITGAVAVEQAAPREPGGSRLVLLVTLRAGACLDRALMLRIKRELRDRASAAHVPAVIAEVPELPTTFSGKVSERAARDAVNRTTAANLSALRNPASVDAIGAHPSVQLGGPA